MEFLGSAWGDTHILTNHTEDSYISECESLCDRYLQSAQIVCDFAREKHENFSSFIESKSSVAFTIPGEARNTLNSNSLNSFLISRMLYPIDYARFDSEDYQTEAQSDFLPGLPLSSAVINLGDISFWNDMVNDYKSLPFKVDMLVARSN